MSGWIILAVFVGMIFGCCIGYCVIYFKEKKEIDDLLRQCTETSNKLASVTKEYEEFIKAAYDLDRWPRNSAHITKKENLVDYLRNKYFDNAFAKDSDGSVCEDEIDNLYV